MDFCVHSTKDVPTELIPDTELCTMLPREAFRKIPGDPAKSGKVMVGDGWPGWFTRLIFVWVTLRQDSRDVLISGDPEKITCIEERGFNRVGNGKKLDV